MADETTGKEGFAQDEDKSLGKQGLEYVLKKVNETGVWIKGSGTKSALLKNHATEDEETGELNLNTADADYSINAGTDNVIYPAGVKSFAEGTRNIIGDEEGGDVHESHVEGSDNKILNCAYGSHIEGTNNKAEHVASLSHIEGTNNATGQNARISHIEGTNNKALDSASMSHIEGTNNTATGGASISHIEGTNNTVRQSASLSHIEGTNNTALEGASISHIEGTENTAKYNSSLSHIEGKYNTANISRTPNDIAAVHLEGVSNTAEYGAVLSHIEGTENTAQTRASHIEGITNSIFETEHGNNSFDANHMEGIDNKSFDITGTHIEGTTNTIKYGQFNHVEGIGNIIDWSAHDYESVDYQGNHVEGYGNYLENSDGEIKLLYNHVEGGSNHIISANDAKVSNKSVQYNHAEGCGNYYYGQHNHVEGLNNIMVAEVSHIEGGNNKIDIVSGRICNGVHVEGKCNSSGGVGNHVEGIGSRAWSVTLIPVEGTNRYEYQLGTPGDDYEHYEPYGDINLANADQLVGRYMTTTYGVEPMYKVVASNGSEIEFDKTPASMNLFLCLGAYSSGTHVEGLNNLAMKLGAHAGGVLNIALGTQAWVTGYSNESLGDNTFVTGKNNSIGGNITTVLGSSGCKLNSGSHVAFIACTDLELESAQNMVYVPGLSIVENEEIKQIRSMTEDELDTIFEEVFE